MLYGIVAANDPVNKKDPSGMFVDAILVASLIVGFAYFLTYKFPIKQLTEVKDCYRPLKNWLNEIIDISPADYSLMLYHRFIWIEDETKKRGYGLAPTKGGELGFLRWRGHIAEEITATGWGYHCSPVLTTSTKKEKLKTAIEADKTNPNLVYDLTPFNFYTCNEWADEMFWKMNQ